MRIRPHDTAVDGFYVVDVDPKTVAKRIRAGVMPPAITKAGETAPGVEDYRSTYPTDFSNFFAWLYKRSLPGVRGASVGGRSTAFPAKSYSRGGTPTWLPIASAAFDKDVDFEETEAVLIADANYGGELPGGVDAIIVATTAHEHRDPIAYASGGPLVAHHVGLNPSIHSIHVWDIDDQGNLDQSRHGGLHYAFRVREVGPDICSIGSTVATPADEKEYAPFFNFGRNGDSTFAFGSTHWDRHDAALSDEAGGPLAPADDWPRHAIWWNKDGQFSQGGLNITKALWGDTQGGIWYSPAEFVNTAWEAGIKGPFIMRVEWREDFDALHTNYCGKPVRGMKKWQSWGLLTEYNPTTKEPPPGTPTPEPRYPAMLVPPETGFPPTAGTPYELESPSRYGHPSPAIPDGIPKRRVPEDDGTSASPMSDPEGMGYIEATETARQQRIRERLEREEERVAERRAEADAAIAEAEAKAAEKKQESDAKEAEGKNDAEERHARARADIARRKLESMRRKEAKARAAEDARKAAIVPEWERENRRKHGAESEAKWRAKHARDQFWMNRFGFTEVAHQMEPITTHEFDLPVWTVSTAVGSEIEPHRRWPTQKCREAKIVVAEDGTVVERNPAVGPGSKVFGPASLLAHHALYDRFSDDWQTDPCEPQFGIIVMAGENAGGYQVDGRFGLGTRVLTSPFVARGQEFRLSYTGTGGVDEPDLELFPKSDTGADGLSTGGAKFIINEDVHITGDLTVDGSSPGGGSGDVVGPASATDNAVARFDGTTGKLLQDSGLLVDDVALGAVVARTANVTSANSDQLTIRTGNTTTSGDSGGLALDVGTAAGTAGAVSVGAANAESVSVGRSGKATSIGGRLTLAAGVSPKVLRVTSDPTLTAVHCVILGDTDGGAFSVTLPATPSAANGDFFIIKNVGSGGNALTVARNGNTINGAASNLSLADGESTTLVWDATEGWHEV